MEEIGEIAAFRALIDVQLQEFFNASRQLGEPMIGLANMIRRAFTVLLGFIVDGVSMERPDEIRFQIMIELLAKEIADIQTLKERNRQVTEWFNHFATVSESIVALSWIGVSPSPTQFVREMRDAGQYFGNRVLSQYRGNQQHQEWILKWNAVLSKLESYVKTYHTTGFNWNIANRYNAHQPTVLGDAGVVLSNPAPPPPPPPPSMDLIPEGGDTRQNLLRDLNQGVGIVRMLKPVSKGQPSQSQQSLPSTSGANLPRQPVAERTYPSKLCLDGRKWRVEHQKDRHDLVIDCAEMSQSLAVFKCQNIILKITKKINGASIDSCKRTNVAVSDIISSVEMIGSQNVKLFCEGHVPLISIDNCDSVEIFLENNSLDAKVVSSKSSSLNISVRNEEGEFREMAVPEQIETVVVNGRLVSKALEKN